MPTRPRLSGLALAALVLAVVGLTVGEYYFGYFALGPAPHHSVVGMVACAVGATIFGYCATIITLMMGGWLLLVLFAIIETVVTKLATKIQTRSALHC
jgi:hypothetical protein